MLLGVRPRGFTLLELLIVLAIVAIMSTIALPSFTHHLASYTNQKTARQLLSAVMLARGYAQVHHKPFSLCPWSAATQACAGVYSEGFAVVNAEGVLEREFATSSKVRIVNRSGSRQASERFQWDGRGIGNRNATLAVCSGQPTSDNWSVVLNQLGRPRLVKNWATCGGE